MRAIGKVKVKRPSRMCEAGLLVVSLGGGVVMVSVEGRRGEKRKKKGVDVRMDVLFLEVTHAISAFQPHEKLKN